MKISSSFLLLVSLLAVPALAHAERYVRVSGKGECPQSVEVTNPELDVSVNGQKLEDIVVTSPALFGPRTGSPFGDNGLAMRGVEEISSEPCRREGLNCETLITEEVTDIGWNESRTKFAYKKSTRQRPWSTFPIGTYNKSTTVVDFDCKYRLVK